MTTAATPKRPEPIVRPKLLEAIAPLLELLGELDPQDVQYVHLGAKHVTVKRQLRGRRGHVIPDLWQTTRHPIISEPVED